MNELGDIKISYVININGNLTGEANDGKDAGYAFLFPDYLQTQLQVLPGSDAERLELVSSELRILEEFGEDISTEIGEDPLTDVIREPVEKWTRYIPEAEANFSIRRLELPDYSEERLFIRPIILPPNSALLAVIYPDILNGMEFTKEGSGKITSIIFKQVPPFLLLESQLLIITGVLPFSRWLHIRDERDYVVNFKEDGRFGIDSPEVKI